MTPLAQNGQRPGNSDNTSDVLDHTKAIRTAVKSIEDEMLSGLRSAQQASLNSADPAQASATVEAMSADILRAYRVLVPQIRDLKSDRANQDPNSMKGRQVKLANDALEASMSKYRTMDNDFRKKLNEQTARQFRIVRPDASEQEVRQAVEDPSGNVFAQAMMQSDRRGQSQSTLNAVKSRNAAIQQIERDMMELGEMFQQMNELVEQQEAAIENIEMKGEEVVENMDKGTEQIGVAITSARNARKWKWWCLGIVSMYYLPRVKSSLPLTDSLNSSHHCRYCHRPRNYQAMANSGSKASTKTIPSYSKPQSRVRIHQADRRANSKSRRRLQPAGEEVPQISGMRWRQCNYGKAYLTYGRVLLWRLLFLASAFDALRRIYGVFCSSLHGLFEGYLAFYLLSRVRCPHCTTSFSLL
jgi:syntaxin 1B/2/3